MAIQPPIITRAPMPAPQRGDRATFSDRVDRWVTWMSAAPQQFQDLADNVYDNAVQVAASATGANNSATLAAGYRDTALAARDQAAGSASAASGSANAAAASAVSAKASSDNASAVTGIPPVTGNATKSLRVNAAGTAMEWVQDGAALGFTPTQQGGGAGQDSGKINIGRAAGTDYWLKATVAGTDIGYLAGSSTSPGTKLTYAVPVDAPAFIGNGSQLTGFTAGQVNTALAYTPVNPAPLAAGTLPVGYRALGTGALLTTVSEKLHEVCSVRDFGAKADGSDDIAAVLLTRQSTPYLHFPRVNGIPTTYVLGAFTAGALNGSVISADPGVTLSLASQGYDFYQNVVWKTDVKVFYRDLNIPDTIPKTPPITRRETVQPPMVATARRRAALDISDALQVATLTNTWPSSDAFTVASATRANGLVSFAADSTNSWKGGFVELGPYETVSAYFENGLTPGPIGVMVRGTTGTANIYTSDETGNYYTAQKPLGGAVVGNARDLEWSDLGQGRYSSFSPTKSVWSMTRVSRNRVLVKLNGKALGYVKDCGDIHQVGFVCYTPNAFALSGFTLARRTDAIIGGPVIRELRAFGDSTIASFPGDWVSLLKPSLDGVFGLKVRSVQNYGVAGTSLEHSLATMRQKGLGNAYYVLLGAGTNSIQGQISLTAFRQELTAFIDDVVAAGRMPVIVMPWMWYGQAQAGGVGQPAQNYDKGAPYRMAAEQIASAKGVLLVNTPEELPNPDPSYLTTDPESPLLRDNIHEAGFGYQLYARAVSQAIIDHACAFPDNVEQLFPAVLFMNGASNAAAADFRAVVDKGGMASFSGTLNVTTIANDTPIILLPRYLRPSRRLNFSAMALPANGSSILGTCYLVYDPVTSTLKITLAPAGTGILILQGESYATLP